MAAVTDFYFTAQEAKDYISKTDAADDAKIKRMAATISRLYEARTHQFFTKDAAVVNRIFWGDGTSCLRVCGQNNVPGIASTSGLVVTIDRDNDGSFADETAVSSSDYELRPLHAALGPQAAPWKEIVLHGLGSPTDTYWPRGYRVQVTAMFGWPAVPDSVKENCLALFDIWWNRDPRGAGISDLDTVIARNPQALSLMKKIEQLHYEPVFA